MDAYNSDIYAGVIGVVGGYLVKRFLKKEVLPVSGTARAIETFLVITVCSIGGKEAKKRIDAMQGPAPKP